MLSQIYFDMKFLCELLVAVPYSNLSYVPRLGVLVLSTFLAHQHTRDVGGRSRHTSRAPTVRQPELRSITQNIQSDVLRVTGQGELAHVLGDVVARVGAGYLGARARF